MRVRFGEFELDPEARRLLRSGQECHLEPKAFDLLELLVARRPAALSKQEIHEHLWPGTFVTDASLSAVVSRLRHAVGAEGRDGLIRTVHGFGYAFAGTAVEDGTAGSPVTGAGARVLWQGTTFALSEGENVLGRDPGGAVFVDDASVSRRHARITVTADGARLEDLGSRNGTFLGERRISGPASLEDGDAFRLGWAQLVYRSLPVLGSTRPVSGPPPRRG